MIPFRSRLLVAFEPSSVAGAVVSRGLGGLRLRAYARAPLPPGALVPSPFDPNLQGAAEVRAALSRVLETLGGGRSGVIVLPDGVGRTALVETEGAVDPAEYARFRLAPTLPFPAEEAIVGVVEIGRGHYLAAAVRRAVAREYEEAAVGTGLAPERVELAPLAALAGLRAAARHGGREVDVVLGEAAFSVAVMERGSLRAFRNRRRAPGPDEGERVRGEVERTLALLGPGPAPRFRVVGPGAPALVRSLVASGSAAEAGWTVERDGLALETAELAWLGAALG